ncbi:MAG: PDZ domain-containing protein [Silvibacterium sp.]
MKCFSRLVLAYTVSCFSLGAVAFAAAEQHVIPVQDVPALLGHSSQSYLGVDIRDVDNDRASALKLKQPTGAEITNVDRDAPAGKAGLRIHDVILQMDGQPVAGEVQLRRMLHETPAGHTITLLISRDGQQQTVTVQLADRATIEQDAWSQRMIVPEPEDEGTFVLEGPSDHGFGAGNGFFGAMSLGSSPTGVELDVLGSQLADYFGVKDGQGLLVKHVAENSPASKAGLKAGDVIIKANGQTMATLGEWMKLIHTNRGKQVQITLVRNRKEQTVTLDAGSGKNHGEMIVPGKLQLLDNEEIDSELAQLKTQLCPETIAPEMTQQQLEAMMASPDWQKLQKQLKEQGQKTDQQLQQLEKEMQLMQLNRMD